MGDATDSPAWAPDLVRVVSSQSLVFLERYRDIIIGMAQLLVRNLDDAVKGRLQSRARRHGRSTEEEVREILRNAVREEEAPRSPLGTRIARRFASVGLDEEILELRGQTPRAVELDP